MSDTLLAILHMCVFPGGAFALMVAMFFKGLDRRVEARLQRRAAISLATGHVDLVGKLVDHDVVALCGAVA